MRSIFVPAIKIMNQLTYKRKFFLIGAISVLVVTLLIYQLSRTSNSVINFSQKELYGMTYLMPVVHVMETMQKYRQSEVEVLNGDLNKKGLWLAQRDDIDSQFFAISNQDGALATMLKTTDNWKAISEQWDAAKKSSFNGPTANTFPIYASIIKNFQILIIEACDNSNLTLDPDIDSYYLMDTYCTKLPSFLEQASLIQVIGATAFKDKTISNSSRENLIVLKTLMGDFNKLAIKTNIEKVINYNASLSTNLSELKDNVVNGITSSVSILENTILASNLTTSADNFNNQYSALRQNGYRLTSQTGLDLKHVITMRVNQYKSDLYMNLALAIISMMIMVYLFIGIYLSIINAIRKLTEGSDKMAKGDLSSEVVIDSHDELVEVASSFNKMRSTLYKIINETQNVLSSSLNGDLSKRISMDQKSGFSSDLAGSINEMNENFQKVIAEIIFVVNTISKGDLTQKIDSDYKGSFGELKNYINGTIDSLTKLIRDIKKSSETIHYGSREIALGNTDLARRTDQQATFLEETSASIDNLTSAVKQNAENAKNANKIVQIASDVAIKGGQVTNQVVTTMITINESSKKVADIVSVIDGIASQTNILALNAAVEAARAGEQGRGFAVVATEIRSLAQRSSSAAKEIKKLISDSVENVSEGKMLVDQSGKIMEDILNEVKRITEIVGEIASASLEQSSGIEQVNKAISQMDQVVQQNMTLVELAANAAESMEAQTRHMDEVVTTFKLSESEAQVSSSELELTRKDLKKLEDEMKKRDSSSDKLKLRGKTDRSKDEWEQF